jgi:hypothetical protein
MTGPLEETVAALREFPWDSDEELVTLTAGHVVEVLRRCCAGELTAREVEDWADAVEMREDLGFEDSPDERAQDAVNFLANPLLNGELTPAVGQEWMRRLRE